MEQDQLLPTQFTAAQLERLHALALKDASVNRETPADYNLRRRLAEYCSQVRSMHNVRRTG